MASGFHFVLVLGLASGLWLETNAQANCAQGNCVATCPSGWTKLGSRCYLFNLQKRDWADAESTCVALGGNLASIRKPCEYKLIRNLVNEKAGEHKTTWLGGYDAAKEGTWLWSDGSRFDFRGWHQGEPNNLGGEHCMEMNLRGEDFVNDQKCRERRSYICARDPSCQ